jgi:hypothetical protein
MPTAPTLSSGRYWNALIALSESLGDCGSGPFGFGPVPRPFALSQMSFLRVTATALGYSAVGIRPTNRSFPSPNTARLSVPDSATSSLPWPTASAVGEEPMPSARATLSVCSTWNESVSITETWSEFAMVTNARWRLVSRAIASGCERCAPTWMVLTTLPPCRSITETVPGVSLLTRPNFLPGRIAAPYG